MRVRNYELMVVLAPDISEEDLPAAFDAVATILSTNGGTITSTHRDSPWGRRRLAYAIRHESRDVRDGYFVLYYFELESTKVVEIERDLRLDNQVMRHMITLQVAPAPQPAPEEPEGEPGTEAGSPTTPPESTEALPVSDVVANDTGPAERALGDQPEESPVDVAGPAEAAGKAPADEAAADVESAPADVAVVESEPVVESVEPQDEVEIEADAGESGSSTVEEPDKTV